MKYRFLDHPAEIKIRVYGKNIEEIIANSLLALKGFLEPELKRKKIKEKVKITAKNQIELLINFLSFVLANTYIKKAVFDIFFKKNIKENLIEGEIKGNAFKKISKDIKAVTYHQAYLKKDKKKIIFEFILDI